MDELIGKNAYKKFGYYEGLVGVIEKSDSGIAPYKLSFGDHGGVGVMRREDIELYEEESG